jgi:putative phosphoribosyl transferase
MDHAPFRMETPYRDRHHAGQALAAALQGHVGPAPLVLALPRGGVPVAYEVALALGAELDLFVVRKLGVPGHEEYAMGAIASGGLRVLDDALLQRLGVGEAELTRVVQREAAELARREAVYREGRAPLPRAGRELIVVDDGLATGSTMLAALRALQQCMPSRLVVAVPTGSPDACDRLAREADLVVCPRTPLLFRSVGGQYLDFDQTGDDEVRTLLAAAPRRRV